MEDVPLNSVDIIVSELFSHFLVGEVPMGTVGQLISVYTANSVKHVSLFF